MGRRVVSVDDEIPMDRLLVVATSVDRGDISHAPGTHYVDGRELSELPFCELLTTVTDDLTPYLANEGTGLYVVCQRVIKAGTANVYALFPLVRRADKTHAECDAHWRDTHAALALAHHRAMTHYVQLSVLATLQGLPYDSLRWQVSSRSMTSSNGFTHAHQVARSSPRTFQSSRTWNVHA